MEISMKNNFQNYFWETLEIVRLNTICISWELIESIQRANSNKISNIRTIVSWQNQKLRYPLRYKWQRQPEELKRMKS